MAESSNDILGGGLQEGNLTPLLTASFLTGQREKALFSHRQHTQLLSLGRAGTGPEPLLMQSVCPDRRDRKVVVTKVDSSQE